MRYEFEWDPGKARQNAEKHRVTFDQAAGVFRDPRAISVYDTDHSQDEDRWMTLGIGSTGAMLVVHHTYVQANEDMTVIRIISSRKATRREQGQYTG